MHALGNMDNRDARTLILSLLKWTHTIAVNVHNSFACPKQHG